MIDISIQKHLTKQEKILIASIVDKYEIYKDTGKSTYSNFINSHQLDLITSYLNSKHIPYLIYEPYDFLEKKIIYFGDYENFIYFYKVKTSSKVTHQQILGTLFSLGLKEDTIGDIIVEDNYFYYTTLAKLDKFLLNNFTFINHQLITLEKTESIVLEKEHFNSSTILVSSMRLDNILSKLLLKSRSQIQGIISDKLVLLNYKDIKNSSIILKESDILSICRVGKFKIGKKKGYTKKDNIVLEIIRYI